MTHRNFSALYFEHLKILTARAERALASARFDHLVIASGVEKFRYLDDTPYPFFANPQFLQWLPLTAHPHCWLSYTPGQPPRLVYYQPDDYWHLPPANPVGYWVDRIDIRIVRTPAAAREHLPSSGTIAILGDTDAALADFIPNNPAAVVNYLHYHRAFKTPYELELMRGASQRAARAHRAAEAAFRAGGSELDIHRRYLEASGHRETDLPYGNIVALNEHAATLHYQHQRAERPSESRSLLIDAGASLSGYAADVTRTYGNGDACFESLLAAMDAMQHQLVDGVRPGRDFRDLHEETHRRLAGVLSETNLIRMTAESAFESGITRTFFPHGLGHLLGLQVHDVGGFQCDEAGGSIPKPEGHPYLRLTRILAPGMVTTIEPGIYFIPTLLQLLRNEKLAAEVNWTRVEHLARFGGIRIEDNVACTQDHPENLTRAAFAALG